MLFLVEIYCRAQPTLIILHDSVADYPIAADQLEVLVDSAGNHGLDQVMSMEFKAVDRGALRVKDIHQTYWFRFKIVDLTTEKRHWILENQDPHIDDFQFYQYDKESQTYTRSNVGLKHQFEARDYPHKNFIFDLNLTRNQRSPYFYIKVKSSLRNPILLRVCSSQYFTSYALSEYYLLGVFYGVLLIMMLYNLFIYSSTKESVYLWYVLYVFSAILLFLSEDGLGFQYLWPDLPGFSLWTSNLSPILLLVSFVLYSAKFLELKEKQTRIYKVLQYATVSYVLYATAIFIFLDDPFLRVLSRSVLYPVPFVLIFVAAIRSFLRNEQASKYFLTAYAFVFIGLAFLLLREIGISAFNNLFTIYSLNIGVMIEVIVLSVALGHRLKLLKEERELTLNRLLEESVEKEKLKDKVNRELEMRVDERTQELTDLAEQLKVANEQLQQQQLEISKMNVQLDLANRKLKNEVKTIATQLTSGKTVSYEEFTEVYPTKESCMIAIAEMKWQNGYECKKCGHDSYCAGKSFRSRRCTRCTFDESVTNMTLFKSLKFPLQKAFYLTYLVFKQKEPVSPTAVSNEIDLRLSTCHHFVKKVQERLRNLKSQKVNLNDWKELVLNESNVVPA